MDSGVNSNYVIDCGNGFSLRIRYHEEYDKINNYSNFYIDGLDVKTTTYLYDFYPDGKLYIDGTLVLTMDSRLPSGEAELLVRNEWVKVTNSSCNKLNIPHNADGTKTITIQFGGNRYSDFSFWTGGSSWLNGWGTSTSINVVLTNIPRASQPSCITYPNNTQNVGDAGTTITIYMNRAVNTFTHTVKYSFGNLSGTIGEKVGNSVTWTIPMNLCTQVPKVTSGTGIITVDTYNGTTKIGTKTCAFTVSVPSNIIPTITSANYYLDNSENSVISSWGNIAVSGFTKIRLTANASSQYGATIVSYSISNAYSTTISTSSLDYTGGKITSSGMKYFDIYAIDTRGRKSEKVTLAVEFQEYSPPSIESFKVSRSEDNSVIINVSNIVRYSTVLNKNKLVLTLKYKTRESSAWSTYGTILANGTYELSDVVFREEYSYDFQLLIKDSIGNSAISTYFISTLAVLMDFRAGGKGLAIGKISESDCFEVELDALFNGDVDYTIDWKYVTSYSSQAYNEPTSITAPLRYGKIGKHVYINGAIGIASGGLSTQSEIIFNLPSEYRPKKTIGLNCVGSGLTIGRLAIASNGNVIVSYMYNLATQSNIDSLAWVYLDAQYFID